MNRLHKTRTNRAGRKTDTSQHEEGRTQKVEIRTWIWHLSNSFILTSGWEGDGEGRDLSSVDRTASALLLLLTIYLGAFWLSSFSNINSWTKQVSPLPPRGGPWGRGWISLAIIFQIIHVRKLCSEFVVFLRRKRCQNEREFWGEEKERKDKQASPEASDAGSWYQQWSKNS